MNEFLEKLEQAKKKVSIADHMLCNTFSLLKDTKILLATLTGIHDAFTLALSAFLAHERALKNISHYSANPESELNFFKIKVYSQYGFPVKYLKTMDMVRETLIAHENAPVEFSRNNNLVIADEVYDLKTVSADILKKDIKTCKDFICLIEGIINSAEEINNG